MNAPHPPTLWFDVTTLAHWQGRPAVGIVRAEREICRHLLNSAGIALRFCYFDRSKSTFLEIDRPQVEAWLAVRPAPADGRPATSARMEQWLQHASLRAIKWLPAPWRLGAKIFLANQRQRVLGLVAALRRREGRPAARPPMRPRGDPVRFAAGDIHVSMGLDWDYKDLAWLYREKQQRNFRCILFCYDLIPYRFPHLYSGDVAVRFARYFVDLAWCADYVFAISDNTRRDLLAFLAEAHHGKVPPCATIRLGCDIETPDPARIGPAVRELLGGDYILYVSTVERRKNHEVLYRAYTRLAEAGLTDLPRLVFVGMRGWGVDDLSKDLRLDPRVAGRIVLLERVNDDELAALYAGCRFTVYPSLYEGWGLPIAEGLAHGKFCLASNAASIPEVGGPLVECLDPWDLPAWTERLRFLFSDPWEVARRNARVKAEYVPPGWNRAAATLLEQVRVLAANAAE